MKGLERQYWRLRDERHRAATLACRLAEAFTRDTTPELLDRIQHAIRVGLLEVEYRLRSWRSRKQPRHRKIKALRGRAGGGSAVIGDHIALCGAHEEALEEFRQLLRQSGDALAWTLLGADSRRIFPLYGTRTHHLNTGVGITAATHIIIQAHRTGQFLVLDNDLTRCIGVGDITVFRSGGRRRELPFSLELKSHLHGAQLIEGAEVSVNFGGTILEDSSQAQLHSDFVQALSLNVGAEDGRSPQSTPQLEEMYDRAQLLVQLLGGRRENLNANKEHWRCLRNVLDRAMQSDAAYDIPEPGIAIMAVRTLKGDHSPRAMTGVMRRLQSEGFPAGLPSLTLNQFTKDDRLSTVAPPIALWPIPLEFRALLLSNGFFLAFVFSGTLWDEALRREGLTRQREEDEWIIHGGKHTLHLDRLEVLKLTFGIAFGGVSPRDVAANLRRVADLPKETGDPIQALC